MNRILRQLTPEERRQVARHTGARAGAPPEELLKSLSRQCGAYVWGIFPAGTPDLLLDHVGRRLGLPPGSGASRSGTAQERAIFAAYFRQAWDAADPDRRAAILHLALAAWDNPSLPRPEFLVYGEPHLQGPAVPEPLLQHSTGCRALAVALETHPLSLPNPFPRDTALRIPVAWRPTGHQVLFSVLQVLWRARYRLLRERRARRTELHRQHRQLESLLAVRSRYLSEERASWSRNPHSGLAITGAAGLSAAVHLALASGPGSWIPAGVVGAAGLAWAVIARLSGSGALADPRAQKLAAQIHSLRHQLVDVEREILALETE